MKIIFFGSRHIHEIVKQLNISFELQLVVTTDKSMVLYCKDEDIPFAQILNLDEKAIQEIIKLEPDLGVVADFGLIIPKKLIDAFPHGIINVHPSLLPKYRGGTPVQSAILNGETVTGISIIKIDEELDHGPILYQEEYQIKPDDSTDKLLINLFKRSAEVLPDLIEKYADGEIDLKQQDDKKATYTKILKKEDGFVEINNPPEKRKLIKIINALSPWPGAWTKYKLTNKEVIIKLLPSGQIQVEGKKPMSYKDFVNGYPKGKIFLQKLSLI